MVIMHHDGYARYDDNNNKNMCENEKRNRMQEERDNGEDKKEKNQKRGHKTESSRQKQI